MRRAFAFLTPIGGAALPSRGAVAWFPVVGAVLGLAVGGVWCLAGHLWPPGVAAALAVAADLALTGLLHFDGLVDSADGLLPPLDRDRRLDVMADPKAGAFGVGIGTVVILLRWAAFAAHKPSVLLVAGVWCASRTVMVFGLRALPYARPSGLAEPFRGGAVAPVVAWAVVASALAQVGIGGPGLASVIAVLAGGGLVLWLASRRIGGFTGDVLGAAGIVGETFGLLIAAAKW
jgi:adenosylcobinamide-GDP ribazoletransferase